VIYYHKLRNLISQLGECDLLLKRRKMNAPSAEIPVIPPTAACFASIPNIFPESSSISEVLVGIIVGYSYSRVRAM